MGRPAAKYGDQVIATDVHIVLVPSAGGPVPTALPHTFSGVLTRGLSGNVRIMRRPAATVNSIAINRPIHIPMAPGVAFQRPPSNTGTLVNGSATVRINGKMAARSGDAAMTCNDPADVPAGTVAAVGTVRIGG